MTPALAAMRPRPISTISSSTTAATPTATISPFWRKSRTLSPKLPPTRNTLLLHQEVRSFPTRGDHSTGRPSFYLKIVPKTKAYLQALINPSKSGCALYGRLLNSGCACVATKYLQSGASTNSTSLPSGLVPATTKPPFSISFKNF